MRMSAFRIQGAQKGVKYFLNSVSKSGDGLLAFASDQLDQTSSILSRLLDLAEVREEETSITTGEVISARRAIASLFSLDLFQKEEHLKMAKLNLADTIAFMRELQQFLEDRPHVLRISPAEEKLK